MAAEGVGPRNRLLADFLKAGGYGALVKAAAKNDVAQDGAARLLKLVVDIVGDCTTSPVAHGHNQARTMNDGDKIYQATHKEKSLI